MMRSSSCFCLLLLIQVQQAEKMFERVENAVTVLNDADTNNLFTNNNQTKVLQIDRTMALHRQHSEIYNYNLLARRYRHHYPVKFYKVYTQTIQFPRRFISRLPSRPRHWPAMYVISPDNGTELIKSTKDLETWLELNIGPSDKSVLPQKLVQDATDLISFPRSGQHLLASLVRSVADQLDLHFEFCERHQAGGRCPETSTARKNHDFQLNFESDKYIVLYRSDRDRNLEALWRWENEIMGIAHPCFSSESSQQHYDNHKYYESFVAKWRGESDNSSEKHVVVEFHDLLRRPVDTLRRVLEFMYGGNDNVVPIINGTSVLENVVAHHNISERVLFSNSRRFSFLHTRRSSAAEMFVHPRWKRYYCETCLGP